MVGVYQSRLDRAASGVLLGAACVSAVAFLVLLGRDAQGTHRVALLPLAAVAATCLLARRSAYRKEGALLLLALGASLLLAELTLLSVSVHYDAARERRARADAQGAAFDERTRLEVLEQLRSDGHAAALHVAPLTREPPSLVHDRWGLLPLGNPSGRIIIGANETGQFMTYRSDEFGFRNPVGMLSTSTLDVLIVGDSFAEGMNVHGDEHVAAILRGHGLRAATVGVGGNGPLRTLASLKEYGPASRPRRVLWFYFEGNDLSDLTRERDASALSAYLEPGHRQDLRSAQPRVDAALEAWLEDRIREHRRHARSVTDNAVLRFASLYHTRHVLLDLHGRVAGRPADLPLGLFQTVLEQAEAEVRRWQGRLHFVYLPCWNRLSGSRSASGDPAAREEVLTRARQAGIDVIDLVPVFDGEARPMEYFPFGLPDHYNARGYRLVADALRAHLHW